MNGQPLQEPLRPTTARWVNRKRAIRDAHDGQTRERWSKVLAHKGGYGSPHGTDTPSDPSGPLQVCFVCSPWSGMIAVDVDDEQAYRATRTAQHIRREHALTTRGGGFMFSSTPGTCHESTGHGRSNAGRRHQVLRFRPGTGCLHWSEQRYEPVCTTACPA